MRHFSSLVIAFVLASSGSVLTQQQLLIQHNDANDPCARFKMRILIPADVADHKLPVKEFTEGIDSKMVWNPCGKERLQLAFGPRLPQRMCYSQSCLFLSSVDKTE